MARNLVVFSWVGLLLGMNPYTRGPKRLLLLTYEGIRPTFVRKAYGERISRERIVVRFGFPFRPCDGKACCRRRYGPGL